MDTTFTLQEILSVQGWVRIYDILAADFVWSEDSFLSSLPVIGATLIGYLVFIYGLNGLLGLLGAKKPTEGSIYHALLKLFSTFHNFNMLAISAVCFVAIAFEAWSIINETGDIEEGIYNVICDPGHKYNTGKLSFWIYVYYLSKFVELLDTLLIVLRRSDLRFIHTYHHVATMAISYMALYFRGTGPWVVILLNTFVHVVMYFYYMLVCLGVKDVWWKNYLTDLQLSQFVLDAIFFSLYIYWDITYEVPKNSHCAGNFYGAIFGLVLIISYFVLFLNLRIANTRKQKRAQEKKRLEKEAKEQKKTN